MLLQLIEVEVQKLLKQKAGAIEFLMRRNPCMQVAMSGMIPRLTDRVCLLHCATLLQLLKVEVQKSLKQKAQAIEFLTRRNPCLQVAYVREANLPTNWADHTRFSASLCNDTAATQD